MEKKSSYLFSADVVRALAICGVVAIHTANMVYARPDFFGGISWWFAITINSISRISVPLFILLSGFLILGKNETFQHTLKRISKRILVPLLFWTFVYSLWGDLAAWWHNTSPTPIHIDFAFLQGLLINLFTGNVFHLYFLVILIGLYIAAPFLRAFMEKESSSAQLYLLKWLLVFGIIETFGIYLFQKCDAINAFTMWLPYTGFFLGGYLLGKGQKGKSALLVSLYSIGLGATLILNYVNYKYLAGGTNLFFPTGCLSNYPDYFLSINVMLMSFSAFLLLIRHDFSWLYHTPILRRITQELARKSFGIYLIHLLLVYLLDAKIYTFEHINPLWIAIIIKWIVVMGLSYTITAIGMKIPIVKYVFGENK